MRNDLATEAVKAAPPITVTGAMLAGLPLDTWIKVMTLAYLVLMISLTALKLWQRIRGGKDGE